MIKYLTIFLFFAFSTLAIAQNTFQDVVYLKNGSIARGTIVGLVPDKFVKIETSDRKAFVYQMDEVEKITKEEIQSNKYISDKNPPFIQGYQGIAEIGYGFKTGDFGTDFIKVNIIHGLKVNPNFALGIGTGIRYYYDGQRTIVPFFADFRIKVLSYGVTPYLALGIGYSFNPLNDFEGEGILFNPSAGVSFRVTPRSAMIIGIGFDQQGLKFYGWSASSGIHKITMDLQNISINVGTSF